MFNRSSARNDPADPNGKSNSGYINVPWLGVSTNMSHAVAYASHGHGVENFVVPNNTASYWNNAGQQLGVGRSRQTEIGLRNPNASSPTQWHASLFQIARPLAYDDGNGSRLLDGKQTHQGLEGGANWRGHQWMIGTTAQWLHAEISDVTQTTGVVGSTPLNVPKFIIRGMAEYRYASVPGLRNALRVSHEGERRVTEDGSLQLPAWTTFDATAHYDTKVNNMASTWTLAVDNLTDKRYWRESPKQFGHYYLYPGAPRTLRASVQFRL
jgi:iron complex outermembrane receptor protein